MSVPFERSQTKQNLMRAFAGESQARNRYTFGASLARDKNLQVIQGIFLFTAEQEKEHAELYYNLLRPFCGENIQVDGSYPVSLFSDMVECLRDAQHNEYQEWEHDYAAFARTAMEEGFPLVGKLFENIAGVEKLHGDRFGRYADLLEQEQLFVSDVKEAWMCLHCGYVVDATVAPANCPVCRHPQGYFIRAELTPFRGESIR